MSVPYNSLLSFVRGSGGEAEILVAALLQFSFEFCVGEDEYEELLQRCRKDLQFSFEFC